MLFITGLLMVIGICNDTATFVQIILYAGIGFALMMISVLFTKYQKYRLTFATPNGKCKTIYTNTLAGKFIIIYKYHRLGYTLCEELTISR